MITDLELRRFLIPWSGLGFVTSCDRVNSINVNLDSRFNIICNLSPFPFPGHWVLLTFENKMCKIFDSLAIPFTMYPDTLRAFIYKNSSKVSASKTPIQSSLSVLCGYFCISRLLSMNEGVCEKDFHNKFNTNLEENDVLVMKLIIRQCKRI